MKFVVGENGRNPEKNLPRPRCEPGIEYRIYFRTEREKLYPGPGLELGILAFLLMLLPTELSRTSTSPP